LADHRICEFPFAPKPVAREFTANHLDRDANGEVAAPEAPGLGIEINLDAVRKYLVDVEIKVSSQTLYATPELA
jgi:L-alanine-DL-glutamate epimerase-like enolase superfamily enzyme